MRLKMRVSHLTREVANKCGNVLERVEEVEWNKDGPLLFLDALSIDSICERKPWWKKFFSYLISWFWIVNSEFSILNHLFLLVFDEGTYPMFIFMLFTLWVRFILFTLQVFYRFNSLTYFNLNLSLFVSGFNVI